MLSNRSVYTVPFRFLGIILFCKVSISFMFVFTGQLDLLPLMTSFSLLFAVVCLAGFLLLSRMSQNCHLRLIRPRTHEFFRLPLDTNWLGALSKVNAQEHLTSHKSTTAALEIKHVRKVPNVHLVCHLLLHVQTFEVGNDVKSGWVLDELWGGGNLAPERDDESIEILLVESHRGIQPDRSHEFRQD